MNGDSPIELVASKSLLDKTVLKHQSVTSALKQLAAEMAEGDRFPTQVELMRQFGVSDRTILRSLDDLCRDGVVVRRRGSGTYVLKPDQGHLSGRESTATARGMILVISELLSKSGFFEEVLDTLTLQSNQTEVSVICQMANSTFGLDDVRSLDRLPLSGVVVFGYRNANIARMMIQRGLKAVVIGAPGIDHVVDVPVIYPDQEMGGYLATHHLIELGHRRIALLGHKSFSRTYRYIGHKRAIDKALRKGIIVHEEIITDEMENLWKTDPYTTADYFRRQSSPTSIITWNDDRAVVALSMLRRAGLSVPDDVSLVGFDNLTSGRSSYPQITTLESHVSRISELAFNMLMSDSPLGQREVVIVPDLIIRESCSAPRLFTV